MHGEQLLASVIVPNWNGKKFLKVCLDSLGEQSFKDFEVIVADNGSTDGSVEFIGEHFPEVKLVGLESNRGFSVAVNEGIKQAESEYIALLNNDTETDPRWLAELVDALEKNPDAGLAASRILFMQDRDRVNSLGIEYRFDGTTADIAYGMRDSQNFQKEREIFGACSAAALYRKALFDDIGMFDEDFFAYAEDVDISFRAQLKGYRCIYVPTAVVYHHGSATGVRHSPFNEYHVRRNEVWVLAKNMPDGLLKKHKWKIILGQFWIVLKSPILIFRPGSFRLFWARVKGKMDGLRKWNHYRKKGRTSREGMRVSDEYIESLFSE